MLELLVLLRITWNYFGGQGWIELLYDVKRVLSDSKHVALTFFYEYSLLNSILKLLFVNLTSDQYSGYSYFIEVELK